jgi:thymidylate synthase
MRQYLDLLRDVMDNGMDGKDRTGTGTRSVFGRQLRFDLAKGFPLVTTKKTSFKNIAHELLWILSGDTNVKYLQDNGVTIWNDWRQPWPTEREMVKVPVKLYPPAEYKGDFRYTGLRAKEGSEEEKLAKSWYKMMNRCYSPDAHNWRFYGGKGVTVNPRWHNPNNFIHDVKEIPHWKYKQADWNNFELDKDYYASNQYGPDTCIWIQTGENVRSKVIRIVTPEGEEILVNGYTEASVYSGFSRTSLHRFINEGLPSLLKANNKKIKEWVFEEAPETESSGFVYRRALVDEGSLGRVYGAQLRDWKGEGGSVDQLARLVKGIKDKPYDRGHIVTMWNPAELHLMALRPCHCFFQCNVRGRFLDLQLYIRSNDLFLGAPYNIASYALLLSMLAQQTKLEPGELVYTIGDAHIYLNHLDQVREQLTRLPLALPALCLDKADSITSYGIGHMRLEGYDPWPAIKGEVSV